MDESRSFQSCLWAVTLFNEDWGARTVFTVAETEDAAAARVYASGHACLDDGRPAEVIECVSFSDVVVAL